jgi:hypothetical protein
MTNLAALTEGLVDDVSDISTEPLDDNGASQEEEELDSEDIEDTEVDLDADDEAADDESDDEQDDTDAGAPDEPTAALKAELESLKDAQYQASQTNQQLVTVAQQLKRELDELKAAQAPKETKPAPNSIFAKMEPEKAAQFQQAQSEWFQNQFGMSPEEFRQTFSQVSQSQQEVIGETNQQRANAYLQERLSELTSEIGAEEIQALSTAAKEIYVGEGNKPIAEMDPHKPWNIPPDLALKAKLADKLLAEKRQTATEQGAARRKKQARQTAADSASTKRVGDESQAVLPDNWADLDPEQAMAAMGGW